MQNLGFTLLALAVVVLGALLSNRLSERTRIPAPAFCLAASAIAAALVPALRDFPIEVIQHLVTVGLVLILFDGGMRLGPRRFRPEAGVIALLGAVGTLATAGALAVLAHLLLDLAWLPALLLGTALSPTDPAVLFSVLGRREITGRSGTVLQGESGVNDPVGVALLAGLLELGNRTGAGAVAHISTLFLVQAAIGIAVGVAAGRALEALLHRVPLPDEGLYPLGTLAGVFAVYGLATVAHGSGFLAVFVAGLTLGDAHAPYKPEIERFHGALAGLGEISAFVGLGMTASLGDYLAYGAWIEGLAVAALLMLVVRPLIVAVLLTPARLSVGERVFLGFAGLKGAVPILLGSFVLTSHEVEGTRVYGVVFVVVAVSVLVQGTLLPVVARWCRVPMHQVPLEPWALGVRFRERPEGLRRHRVEPGSRADRTLIADLELPDTMWVALVIRRGRLVPVQDRTELKAGDEVVVLTDPEAPDGSSTRQFRSREGPASP
ncbi:sodium:proton exchanger [Streptomyces sp. HC44]|uniref:Sodium:proton exchanger n=2 Tax=Streptomyces scabichelini TaxID=2711217 RepID=A0A6G4VDB1_9ACTN|nr:cation:proton antiporter [Streptomyces scabichelini]NGO11885.1 sodium:proton exchanger [Streptomyces scabichelini]